MEFKFEVFRELLFISENNPSESSIDKTVFMTGTVLVGNFGKYVLILLTLGISKPNFTLGVAKGQNMAPLAPSTWMGMSRPVSS
jgi:hypothetical protein